MKKLNFLNHLQLLLHRWHILFLSGFKIPWFAMAPHGTCCLDAPGKGYVPHLPCDVGRIRRRHGFDVDLIWKTHGKS